MIAVRMIVVVKSRSHCMFCVAADEAKLTSSQLLLLLSRQTNTQFLQSNCVTYFVFRNDSFICITFHFSTLLFDSNAIYLNVFVVAVFIFEV